MFWPLLGRATAPALKVGVNLLDELVQAVRIPRIESGLKYIRRGIPATAGTKTKTLGRFPRGSDVANEMDADLLDSLYDMTTRVPAGVTPFVPSEAVPMARGMMMRESARRGPYNLTSPAEWVSMIGPNSTSLVRNVGYDRLAPLNNALGLRHVPSYRPDVGRKLRMVGGTWAPKNTMSRYNPWVDTYSGAKYGLLDNRHVLNVPSPMRLPKDDTDYPLTFWTGW